MKRIKRSRIRYLNNVPKQKEYKFSSFRVFLFLLPPIIWLVLFIILYYSDGHRKYEVGFYFAFIFLMLVNSPNVILCINYLMISSIKKIIFDVENETIKIIDKEKENTIRYSEISYMERIKAAQGASARGTPPWFDFGYSILHLRNDEKIVITCLAMNQLKLLSFLITTKIIHKEKFIPFLQKT